MKYKLLAEKGVHLVCLEDCTRLPTQTLSVVTQHIKNPAVVRLEVLCRTTEQADGWMVFKNGGLYFNGVRLEGLDKLWFRPDFEIHKSGTWGRCSFFVEVDLVDTVEKPKTPNL